MENKWVLWVISIVCAFFVLLIIITNVSDTTEKKINAVNTKVENLENKDENIKKEINNFAESVKDMKCTNEAQNETIYWTAFVYKYKWEKYVFTTAHNIVKNQSKFLWMCGATWLGSPFWDERRITFNNNSDFAAFKYYWDTEAIDIPLCNKIEKKWEKVWVIWFPTYTNYKDEYGSDYNYTQTITNGIISWYTTIADTYKQTHLNYFVTSPLDVGNSWWPAILQTKDWFCLLWIMTWGQKWTYTTQGIIQNIYNVLDEE